MKESKLTKGELFSVSARCHKCGKAMNMRVSDNREYAYHCIKCNKDFDSSECLETVSDFWEITLLNKDAEWYKKNRDILNQTCKNYNVDFMGCDYFDKDAALIDFGWKEPPSAEQIQKFTDEIIKLL